MTGGDREGPRGGEGRSGRLLSTLRAALEAGLLAGILLGVADGVVAGTRTPTAGVLVWAGCLAGAAVTYGAFLATGLALVSLPFHAWLKGKDLPERRRFLLAVALGLGLFLDLYWWSRPYVLWGVPATDPRRVGASVAMLALGLALGFLLGRLGGWIAARVPRASLAAAILVGLAWIGGTAFLATAGADVSARGQVNERTREMPSVLLFVVDALRADVLGCYGNERVRTPVIDSLAARGVVFENAFVQAPFTWSSFGSILTGKYPRRHGLLKMAPGVRMPENVTLASHLASAPLRTGGRLRDGDFASATFMTGTLSHGSGLLHGFDAYFEAMVGHPLVEVHDPWSVFRSELVLSRIRAKLAQRFERAPVAAEAVRWLRENGRKRFVAMVHFYSTHTPYDPPADYREMYVDPEYRGPIQAFYAGAREAIEAGEYVLTPADREQIRNLYYAGVTQADAMIGEVLAELERQGVLRETLVIVTADHGEELGDHDLWEHNFMYQTNLRVPLVMALPGALPSGARVGALVESVDILPTVCDLLGIEVPEDTRLGDAGSVDGVSLVPLAREDVDRVKPFAFAENGRYLSIQDREWKLVVRPAGLDPEGWEKMLAGDLETPQLYDLARDPGEHENVLDRHRDQAERLLAELRSWSDSMPRPREVIVESARDREFAQHLEALGYAGGVGQGLEEEPGSR